MAVQQAMQNESRSGWSLAVLSPWCRPQALGASASVWLCLAATLGLRAEVVQIKSVASETFQPARNLLSNPSFEETRTNGIPVGWHWDRQNTDAACVTDRNTRLEAGVVPDAPIVFVPSITHFSDAALVSLRRFKGRLVFIGEGDLLAHDEFGRSITSNLSAETIGFRHGATSARALHTQLTARLLAWNLRPAIEFRGAGQQPVWGVEWRSAETREGTVVNLCNYEKVPVPVALSQGGLSKSARDVLTGALVEWPWTLAPLAVRLLRLEHR